MYNLNNLNAYFISDITRQERSHMEGKRSVEMARHSYPWRLIYPSTLVLNFPPHIHERIHICNNSRAFLYLITVQTSSNEIKCNFTHRVFILAVSLNVNLSTAHFNTSFDQLMISQADRNLSFRGTDLIHGDVTNIQVCL